MGDIRSRLEAEYCPPLDPALLSAIVSDYDLSIEENVREARSILDALKESALLEEQLGFDPSGTGAQDDGFVEEADESGPAASASVSRETELTSISNGLGSLDLNEEDENDTDTIEARLQVFEHLEGLDEGMKVFLLQDVFGGRVSRFNALDTLRKCDGKWLAALDILLNYVYLDGGELAEDGGKVPLKGIDGFSEDNIIRRSRKGKQKKRRQVGFPPVEETRSQSLPVSPSEIVSAVENRWQTSAHDIDFISSRTGLTISLVTSTYHSNGACLPRAIEAILERSIRHDKPTDDPIIAVNAYDLKSEFPAITSDHATALVRLTHPSTAAAHELAKALIAPRQGPGGIQVVPQYVPPEEVGEGMWQTITQKRRLSHSHDLSSPGGNDAATRASAYNAARYTALAKARAAHRRAKSDRLMGGVAAYYGQMGRDYASLSSQASAAAADELTQRQSTPSELDLHGVDVLNAVRIAQEKVETWWHGLGENRANGRIGAMERQAGYKIIVGLGKHSEGGNSKLGPAVSKMLRNEGWKFEHAGGVIIVTGKARKS